MIGIFLVFISSFFRETSSSIGKFEVSEHKESIYTMGFLTLLWGALFFFIIAFFRGEFLFSLASLPTFIPRVILEIAQVHVAMLAITTADRSTFGFLRIWTIPLILAVDFLLGYEIGLNQIIGISIIVISFIFLFFNHGIRKKGAWLVMFTAINAVATISLFKYNITHFNSVEAEQGIIRLILIAYFLILAFFVAKENPLKFLKKPIFFIQSFSAGLGSVILSFAYLFAPASIIVTAKRSFSILWTIPSGKIYFHEKKLLIKIISFILIVIGLIFLAV